jgi:hypothetical protein
MQGMAEAIKYLYQHFILRDVVAYVAPGAILAACLLRLHYGGLDPALKFIKDIPPIAYVPIYGLLFTIGLGIQNFGEMIKFRGGSLLKDHTRENNKVRFDKLQEFHRAVLSSQVSKQMVNEYTEVLERTRERIEIKKYASGNIAVALVMTAISMLVAKTFTNSASWVILAIGAILAVSLIHANRSQARNVQTWEDEAIRTNPQKNLKV